MEFTVDNDCIIGSAHTCTHSCQMLLLNIIIDSVSYESVNVFL